MPRYDLRSAWGTSYVDARLRERAADVQRADIVSVNGEKTGLADGTSCRVLAAAAEGVLRRLTAVPTRTERPDLTGLLI